VQWHDTKRAGIVSAVAIGCIRAITAAWLFAKGIY